MRYIDEATGHPFIAVEIGITYMDWFKNLADIISYPYVSLSEPRELLNKHNFKAPIMWIIMNPKSSQDCMNFDENKQIMKQETKIFYQYWTNHNICWKWQ